MKKAVFAGTFDPITLGHVDVITRASELFDEIIIAIGVNSKKQTLFTLEQRVLWIEQTFAQNPKIKIDTYEGLTVEFCKKHQATYLLRGLRNGTDFDYESHIAQLNRKMNTQIETVFLLCAPELSYISSTMVRDLITFQGDYSSLVPAAVVVPK